METTTVFDLDNIENGVASFPACTETREELIHETLVLSGEMHVLITRTLEGLNEPATIKVTKKAGVLSAEIIEYKPGDQNEEVGFEIRTPNRSETPIEAIHNIAERATEDSALVLKGVVSQMTGALKEVSDLIGDDTLTQIINEALQMDYANLYVGSNPNLVVYLQDNEGNIVASYREEGKILPRNIVAINPALRTEAAE